ncbi:MAG TPA: amino acid permease [Gemmatimonadales bacterium]|nr:amino acid permease [Gemmatimonadales bacterium]
MTTPVSYARRLGLFSGTMAVIGGIIGSGIFATPNVVAQRVGTAGLALGTWVVGGLIALAGAYCYGELGERMPKAGGQYVYLRDAFGPLSGFLYAWALLLIMATGAAAFVAVTFANYTVALLGLPAGAVMPLAVGAIVLVCAINYVGVAPGAITQNIFTILKLCALAVLIVVGIGFALPATSAARVLPPIAAPAGFGGVVLAVGAALVPVLFTCGGWQQTNFIAEEMVEPETNLPRALLLGVLAVIAVYLLANIAYLRVLGIAGLAATPAPAAEVMARVLGPGGRIVISAGIALSAFGFLDLVVLVTPRVFQAMAADGVFFRKMAELHPRYRTPTAAILLMGAWAIVLALTKTYGPLTDYVVFGDWIFFGSSVATLFVYRQRERATGKVAPLKFRTPGYPLVPALFVLAAIYVVLSSVRQNPGNAAKGAGLLLLGVPVFVAWRRRGALR